MNAANTPTPSLAKIEQRRPAGIRSERRRMTTRDACMKIHRWSGLLTALFLAVAGLTGTVLAYQHELEAALLPAWIKVAPREQMLHAQEQVRIVERTDPRVRVSRIHLVNQPDLSTRLWLEPRIDAATGRPYPLQFDEVFVDPYTGEVLGRRLMSEIGFDAAHMVPMIYRLHYSLLLGDIGVYLFGIVALTWVLNCFLGGYLTFPVHGKQFFKGWRRSWAIRSAPSVWRLSFEFHRAAGLWLWGVLLIFALSAVQFNLNAQVFRPALEFLMSIEDPRAALAKSANRDSTIGLDWTEALERGRVLMEDHARRRNFAIEQESYLLAAYSEQAYVYAVRSSLDVSEKSGQTRVFFSMSDGRELAFDYPTIANGNTVSAWLSTLHMGYIGGRPYQAFVAFMGLVVALLSMTGVMVWIKRRGNS